MPDVLTTDTLTTALAELPRWSGDTAALSARIECPDFPAAITLVARVGEVAEALNHHPDMDIRWRTVTFGLSTHSAGGVTELDLTLARRIDALADTLTSAR